MHAPPSIGSPSFSVITAVRNGASTITGTLLSVAKQTWPHVEHLVVDGGSTDNTLEVVRAHGMHVGAVISERDEGIYDAFNKGLALAKGEVVCFLNADDHFASPTVLADVARVFAEASCDAVFGDALFVDRIDTRQVLRWYDSGSFRPDRIRFGMMPAHPAMFVSRHVYQAVGPFDASYEIAGDFEFVARAFGVGRTSYRHLPQVLAIVRTGGISTRGFRSKQTISRELLRACRQNGIASSELHVLARYLWKLRALYRGWASSAERPGTWL